MTKKQDQESLIAALKDNVAKKMELINSLISENRELEDHLQDLLRKIKGSYPFPVYHREQIRY